jgi:hypothetical protein
MKTPAYFKTLSADFTAECLRLGGTLVEVDCIGRVHFLLPSPLGPIAALLPSPCDSGRRKGPFYEEIYLRFKTYRTGKAYDQLCGWDFNGYSGKWNLMAGGETRKAAGRAAIDTLRHRIEVLKESYPSTSAPF